MLYYTLYEYIVYSMYFMLQSSLVVPLHVTGIVENVYIHIKYETSAQLSKHYTIFWWKLFCIYIPSVCVGNLFSVQFFGLFHRRIRYFLFCAHDIVREFKYFEHDSFLIFWRVRQCIYRVLFYSYRVEMWLICITTPRPIFAEKDKGHVPHPKSDTYQHVIQ